MREHVVWLAFVMAACDGGNVGSSQTEVQLLVSEALCDRAAACEATSGQGYTSAAACLALAKSTVDCGPWYLRSILNDDASAASACADAIAELPCAELGFDMEPPSGCEAFSRIGQQVGDSCEGGTCAPGLTCVTATVPGTCATCQPAAGLGGACSRDRDCDVGLYCDDSGATATCLARLEDTAWCTSNSQCLSGWCRESTGQCSAPIADGASCLPSDECAGLRGCVDGVCGDRLAIGAACANDGECVLDARCDGGVCTAVDYCSTPELGHRCVGNCAAGAYCSVLSAEPTCQPVLSSTDTCDFVSDLIEGQCGSDAYCSFDTSQCTPVAAIGDTCTIDYECADGGFCDSSGQPSVCRALGDVGAACSDSLDCTTLNCDVATYTCAEPNACVMP